MDTKTTLIVLCFEGFDFERRDRNLHNCVWIFDNYDRQDALHHTVADIRLALLW